MIKAINFEKLPEGLLPTIIQDSKTGVVLRFGYMNRKSLKETVKTNIVVFVSAKKSKKQVADVTNLKVTDIKAECDGTALLIKAIPNGKVCGSRKGTCFGEINKNPGYLYELERFVKQKKLNPVKSSLTSRLLTRGNKQIAKKLGEEAVELVLESTEKNDKLFKGEAADVLYHFVVLLGSRGISVDEVLVALKKRRR